MYVDAFHFDLPEQNIARYPIPNRSEARLMVLDDQGALHHARFKDLLNWLQPHDLLVLNDSRVCHARLTFSRKKGGKLSGFFTRLIDAQRFEALLKPAKRVHIGEVLFLGQDGTAGVKVIQALGEGRFLLACLGSQTILGLLDGYGQVPIPPYLKRPAQPIDIQRYQTIYGKTQGSLAASTAGLHFDQALLNALAEHHIDSAFVTLHIGLGTFAPVRVQSIEAHVMHSEAFSLPAETVTAIERCRLVGGRVIAVGTSVLRVLETMAKPEGLQSGCGETQLFVYPGFKFQVVDHLITNFHLPKSTLLMLVAAFVGLERIHALYQSALQVGYQFLSYGDAMFLPLCQKKSDF